jgi:hypothetical protein
VIVAILAIEHTTGDCRAQLVVVVGSSEILDTDQLVAGGVSGTGAGGEVDAHVAAGNVVIRAVEAVAAVKQVGSRTASKGVIPRKTEDLVVSGETFEEVIVGRAGQDIVAGGSKCHGNLLVRVATGDPVYGSGKTAIAARPK